MSLRWRLGMALIAMSAIGLTGCPALNQGQGPTHNPNWSYHSAPTMSPGAMTPGAMNPGVIARDERPLNLNAAAVEPPVVAAKLVAVR